jgi:hypothetical protein
MEWVIESYDRRTDRDGENRFTTEAAFIRASEDLLHQPGGCLATLPDGTLRDEPALRALIAGARLTGEARRPTENPRQPPQQTPRNAGGRFALSP